MAYGHRSHDEYHTQDEFRQLEQIKEKGGTRALVCFCIDVSRSMTIILPEYEKYIDHRKTAGSSNDGGQRMQGVQPLKGAALETRIGKLNKILGKMLRSMKNNPELNDALVVSIITFDEFAEVKNSFMDLSIIEPNEYANVKMGKHPGETYSGRALQHALQQIDFMKLECNASDVDLRRPTIIFLSDGEPSDTDSSTADMIRISGHDTKNDAGSMAYLIRQLEAEGSLKTIPILIGERTPLAHNYMTSLSADGEYFFMMNEWEYDKIFELIEQDLGERFYVSIADESGNYIPSVQTESKSADKLADTNTTLTKEISMEEAFESFMSSSEDNPESHPDSGEEPEEDEFLF